jgi:stage II sporulation protein AA (anti-sigma F factor antagonist)
MTQILKEGGKTIIKTGSRIDTQNAAAFEKDIEPALQEPGMDLEMDCTELVYMASSGLRIIQKTMRAVMMKKGKFKITNVSPEIYKVLAMTGFTKFMTVEQKQA